VLGVCKHGNESLGCIHCWKVLDKLSNWQLLTYGSAPWRLNQGMTVPAIVSVGVLGGECFQQHIQYRVLSQLHTAYSALNSVQLPLRNNETSLISEPGIEGQTVPTHGCNTDQNAWNVF
jgi:hypothetical protein